MAGGKETPRQKMIGMMYLVLTALLALNVSKEIINAFVTLNNKIEVQNKNFEVKNEGYLDNFEAQKATLKANNAGEKELAKVQFWENRAIEAHNFAKRTVNYVMGQAGTMLKEGQDGEWVKEDDRGYKYIVDLIVNEYGKKDDYDTPTRLFVEHKGNGEEFLGTIMNYRDSLAAMVADFEDAKGNKFYFDLEKAAEIKKENEADTTWVEEELEPLLETVHPDDRGKIKEIYRVLTFPEEVENHGEKIPWIQGIFDHAPMVAAAAMMTSIKGQILQAEGVALQHFASKSDVPPFKFNKIEPLAFSKTSYINQGDSLGVRVMIAAYDSTEEMELKYWMDDSAKTDEKMQEFSGSAGQELIVAGDIGEHTVYGEIAVEVKGAKEWKPWKFKYKVGSPTAAIGNYETNVLYAGYKNKVIASGGGADPESQTLSASSGSVKPTTFDGGVKGYIVDVSARSREVTLTLNGKNKDGESVTLGSQKFRVMRLPDPLPFLAGIDPAKGEIQRNALRGAQITPVLKGSPLQVSYSVKDYVFEVSVNGRTKSIRGNGPAITPDMYNTVKGLRPGANITLRNVRVNGPSGVRILPAVSFKLR